MKYLLSLSIFFIGITMSAQRVELVKDINTRNTSNPYISNPIVFKDQLFFTSDDQIHGIELWVTDGTLGGEKLFADIRTGNRGSAPGSFVIFNDKLYFAANDGVHGQELWVTDGTIEGTKMVADINANANSSNVSTLAVYNNKLYF